MEEKPTGRPRKYCSDRCRSRWARQSFPVCRDCGGRLADTDGRRPTVFCDLCRSARAEHARQRDRERARAHYPAAHHEREERCAAQHQQPCRAGSASQTSEPSLTTGRHTGARPSVTNAHPCSARFSNEHRHRNRSALPAHDTAAVQ